DVYGFTTRQFQPRSNVLFVNDYCEGQSFLYKLGYNNDYAAAYPVESYYLYNPSGTDPRGLPLDGRNTGAGGVWYDTIRGFYNEGYDVWRIICRGPVPPWVYQYYLPTVEYQLDPQEALSDPEHAQPTRRVLVADRAVVWASPHTGDLWVADGSLIDAATQADLALFLDRGGRLFICGEDIAWALTMNGTTPNEFLSRYLRAAFVRDTPVISSEYPHLPYPDLDEPLDPVTGRGLWWRVPRQIAYGTGDSFNPTATGADPVTNDPWIGAVGAPYMHEQFSQGGAQNPTDLDTPRLNSTSPDYTDAAEFSFRPDIIQPLSGAQAIYTEDTTDLGVVGLRYEDLNSGARVVYLSFGFEQIHRGWNNGACYNRRAALMHNVLCWMRTGGFQGRVLGVDGKPIRNPNPIVYCYRQAGGQARELVAAVRCQDDGTYVLQGLPPFYYSLEATRPGFTIDKYDGEFVHGGLGNRIVDFVIYPRQPGAIHGIVTSEATGEAIPGVRVCVNPVPRYVRLPDGTEEEQLPEGQWPKCTTTGPDGSYTLSDLPPWDYDVTADGGDVGYGSAGPETVTVNAGGTARVDFQLPAADGTVVVTVLDAGTQQPIEGATVELQVQGRTIRSGRTNAQGVATIAVQPGQYQVVADAAGYGRSAAQSVTVESGGQVAITIYMQPQPGGRISGRVVSAISGEPVGGVVVRMYVGDREIASVVTTPVLQRDTPDGPQYNFKFDPAPAGTVVIRPEPEGFASRPAEQAVTVVSGQETANIVFRLTSVHTFARGLHLISLPGDYTAYDPAQVFGLTGDQRLRLAAWEASRQQYSVYPQAPADRIRPGVGYWIYLSAATELARRGAPAPAPTEVRLYPTWNLIGCPFESAIDASALRVRDANGVEMDWQTARARGKILSVLYAYVIGQYQPSQSLAPYIGYWLACSEALTLVIPNVSTTGARGSTVEPFPKLSEHGWAIQLRVESGNLIDGCTYIGIDPRASNGFDAGLDELKPPAPDLAPNVYACSINSASGQNYAVDIRRDAAGQVFRILVHCNVPSASVAVRWPDLSAMPQSVRPVLVDPACNKRLYMRTATGYEFTARGDRVLEIHLEGSSSSPLAVSGVRSAATGEGRVQIAFSLSKQADVEVQIMNIAGRVVRFLAAGQALPAGRQSITWDGRDLRGAKVPAGQYLVVVKATAPDGEQAQAVGQLQLSR
ncbi:MAG: carboxypeptidase regulatory-like domain-containing protein, partial [Armatimonadetes bacterium]|nr:carboxypeptidase regulatory-like domain-containing protein [Armatimonadota bacterium]